MNLVNIYCDPSSIRNFGVGNCNAEFGSWKYALLVPKNWTLTPAEIQDLLPTLLADNTANSPDARIYLIGNFHTTELSYQDANQVTRPDGSTRETRPAVAGWRLTMDRGGICTSRALQSISNLQDTYNIVFISTNNALVGTQRLNLTTGDNDFAGYDLSMLTAETPLVGEFENVDRYPLMVQLADRDEMFKTPMLIAFDVDDVLTAMPNITDVQIERLGAAISGSGVVDIAMAAGCGATNLAAGSTAATWANVARFVVTNWLTGAAVTLTSVAVNASGTGFTLDVDNADADYPTSGQYLAVSFASVSTLATAGLKYFAPYAQNANGINGTKLLIKIP